MATPRMERTRINNRLPVAREGFPFIMSGCILILLAYAVGLYPVAILLGALTFFTVYFFRDPERQGTTEENAVVTPADGKCLGIKILEGDDTPIGEPAVLISVFMSLFNVHVNRVPASGSISEIVYHPGKFFSANLDKASHENENNRIVLHTNGGHKIAFFQIAGLIARRIACWIQEGDRVCVGQRFGLIRFGSRLDLYLPRDSKIMVTAGSKVKAGITILGYLS